MATTTEKVLLQFEVDATGAVSNVRKVDDALKTVPKSAQDASSALGGMKQAMQLLGDAVAGASIISFFKAASAAAAEEEQVMTRLGITMQNAGAGFAVTSGQVQGFLANIQATTRYADDEAAKALNSLIGITGNYGASLKGMGAAMDLAAGRGIELNTAAELIGKAIAGNTGTLSRYGIVLDKGTQEMLRHASATERAEYFAGLFNEKFGGAAQAEFETASGQIASLTNTFGDLQEAVGQAINEVVFDPDIVQPFLAKIRESTTEVNRLREAGSFDAMKRDMKALADATAFVVKWVVKAAEGWSYLRLGAEVAITKVMALLADLVAMLTKVSEVQLMIGQRIAAALGIDWLEDSLETASDTTDELLDSFTLMAAGLHQQSRDASDALETLVYSLESVRTETDAAAVAMEDLGDSSGGAASEFADLAKKLAEIERRVDATLDQYREWKQVSDSLMGGTEELIGTFGEFDNVVQDTWDSLRNSPEMNEVFIPDDARTRMLEIWGGLAEDMGRILKTSLADGLMAAFSGDGEGVLDAFTSMTQQMGTRMADFFIEALGTIGSVDSSGNRISFGDVMRTGGWQALVGMAGAGIQGHAQSSGNQTAGAIGGALSGAASGAAWGSVVPVVGTVWGAVIGAVVGGVMGYLSSQGGETPETGFSIGEGGDVTGMETGGHQGFGEAQRTNWARRVQSAYRAIQNQYMDVLRMFEMPELFSMLGDRPTFTTGGVQTGSADTWLQMLTQDVLPDLFQDWAEGALGAGLSAYGVSGATQEQLFAELGDTAGSERLGALQAFIGAVVNSSKLLEDMDWGAMEQEVGATSLEQFGTFITDTLDGIDVAMQGMDQMDLISRANQAQEIEQLIGQARQAEIQYLQQIRQMQDSVNRSIQSQIEGIQVGGMTEREKISYGESQIQDLMAQLASATAPEQISFLVSEIQRYVGMVQGAVGDNLYTSWDIGTGQTWSEYLISMLEEAQALANERFGVAEDEVASANDLLIEQLERLREALGIVADDVLSKFGEASGNPYSDALLAEAEGLSGGAGSYTDALLAEINQSTSTSAQSMDRTSASIDRLIAFLADRLPQTVNVIVRGGGGAVNPHAVSSPVS